MSVPDNSSTRSDSPQQIRAFRLDWTMALFLILVSGSAVAGYFAVRTGRTTVVPPPGLSPDGSVRQFGTLRQNTVVSASFELTNHYAEGVQIKRASAGCSCQEVTVSKRELAPGDTTTVTVVWRLGTRRGRAFDLVDVLHTLPGGSDNPSASRTGLLTLRLEADVAPDIVYEPAVLRFAPGQPGSATLLLSPGAVAEFTARRVTSNSKSIRAKLLPDGRRVEVTYSPEDERDRAPDLQVLVETDSINEPTLAIPVVFDSTKP